MERAVFEPGRCCVPGCKADPKGSAMCITCWFDLEDGERAVCRMAEQSPFDPDLKLMERRAALGATAEALAKRRRRKAALRRLKKIRDAVNRRAA